MLTSICAKLNFIMWNIVFCKNNKITILPYLRGKMDQAHCRNTYNNYKYTDFLIWRGPKKIIVSAKDRKPPLRPTRSCIVRFPGRHNGAFYTIIPKNTHRQPRTPKFWEAIPQHILYITQLFPTTLVHNSSVRTVC
jgi:hypothetical protein